MSVDKKLIRERISRTSYDEPPKIKPRKSAPSFKPKQDEISFDAKSTKLYIGQKIFLTLSEFFEKEFAKFYKDLSPAQKITVMQLSFATYFPKEVKLENVDPFDDWSDDELHNFVDKKIKPKGKIIYTVK